MGKETSFNRKNVQYEKIRRKKIQAFRKQMRDKRPQQTEKQIPEKKKRREQRKLEKKMAKVAAKRQKRDGMNIEEGNDKDWEDMKD
mmetsp:Transcript_74780/g.86821  ORF Transcript_74780/g.86821 Transcript_74780/m.86821 type:complete len:86 (+) Transcript_74780:14-271(+)